MLSYTTGSQDVASDKQILEKYGVTHILNLSKYCQNHFSGSITYRNVQCDDYIHVKVCPMFPDSFKFIDEGRAKGCVFIHCSAGVSRAATFTIAYLMKTEGMPFNEAFDYVKSKRPRICPNEGFMAQLKQYDQELGLSKQVHKNRH